MNVDQVAGGNGQDKDFDPIYEAFLNAQVPEAKDDDDALPRGSYIIEFKGGKGGFGAPKAEEKIPQVRLPFTVVEGQGDTVGQSRFANLKIGVTEFAYGENEQGVRVRNPLTKDELNTARVEHAGILQRVANTLALLIGFPARPYTEESLTEYAKGFAGKRAAVIIGVSAAREGFEPSNWIKWSSIRSLDEKVVKNGVDLGTALDYTRKKIAADNQKAAKKSGRTTAAAAAVAAPAADAAKDFS